MLTSEQIENAKDYIANLLKKCDPSHDFYHVERVLKNALLISKREMEINSELKLDMDVVILASLFHDAVDFKYDYKDEKTNFEEIIFERLGSIFKSLNISKNQTDQIIFIILNISFRKELEENKDFDFSMEFKIVRDADRLDAIGAIGIARCFGYSCVKGNPFYSAEMTPNIHMSADEYNKTSLIKHGTAYNHFFEKLLTLKDRMMTNTGKGFAINRHVFMVDFLKQFENEMNFLK